MQKEIPSWLVCGSHGMCLDCTWPGFSHRWAGTFFCVQVIVIWRLWLPAKQKLSHKRLVLLIEIRQRSTCCHTKIGLNPGRSYLGAAYFVQIVCCSYITKFLTYDTKIMHVLITVSSTSMCVCLRNCTKGFAQWCFIYNRWPNDE